VRSPGRPGLLVTLSDDLYLVGMVVEVVSPVTRTMRSLEHHVRIRQHPLVRCVVPRLVIPKDRSRRLRLTIKQIFNHRATSQTLRQQPSPCLCAQSAYGAGYVVELPGKTGTPPGTSTSTISTLAVASG
jgi:hypothetical protein